MNETYVHVISSYDTIFDECMYIWMYFPAFCFLYDDYGRIY